MRRKICCVFMLLVIYGGLPSESGNVLNRKATPPQKRHQAWIAKYGPQARHQEVEDMESCRTTHLENACGSALQRLDNPQVSGIKVQPLQRPQDGSAISCKHFSAYKLSWATALLA